MPLASTRDLIIDAAVTVAARRGISSASMDEIAEEAGLAKGSLYYNFPSKDAIFEEVLRGGFARLAEAIEAARADAPTDTALRSAVTATLETLRAHPERAKIVASEVFRTERPWVDAVGPARDSLFVLYRDALRATATAARAARVSESAGAAIFGAIAGAGLDWLLFRPDRPLADVVEEVLALIDHE